MASGPVRARSRPEPAAEWHAVVLSPHFDDAALSCGGTIHARAARGERVLVWTVCAGAPDPAAPLSAFALELHERWLARPGDAPLAPDRVVARRRQEDARALAALGAQGRWWSLPDAVYRHDADARRWSYADAASLFGPLSDRDLPVVERLTAALSTIPGLADGTEVVAPLAAGGHVDHQLVRLAAESWRGVGHLAYYEDYPYVEDARALVAQVAGDPDWCARLSPLTQDDLRAKVEAVAAYASQISTFWPDAQAMASQVRAFALRTGAGAPAERFWRRPCHRATGQPT